jgi:NAD+ synthase
MVAAPIDASDLDLDCAREVERIHARVVDILATGLRRRGAVVAVSGGIDSAVCLGLVTGALGSDKVLALFLPEQDSSPQSLARGKAVADQLGVKGLTQDITATLEAIGCYHWRDEAIRAVFPEYGPGWKNKIAIGGGTSGQFNFFKLVVESPSGERHEKRLPHREYLQIVAAQNYKQRVRKTIEYFHADRLNYAVVGTPNRLEYDQGFFVKNGDGSADLKPIAHLYKTQVYALARFLGLPSEIVNAAPTTDTYSLEQGQDEFYFAVPYAQMDVALWGKTHGRPAAEVGRKLGMPVEQVELLYRDIDAKRAGTRPLHARPYLIEPVTTVHPEEA